jgi:TonB family protein
MKNALSTAVILASLLSIGLRCKHLARQSDSVETNSQRANQPQTAENKNPAAPQETPEEPPLNDSAVSLPKPVYPPAARAVKASGDVVVRIEVDAKGNVVSARAVSGHQLLRASAEAAARQAKFRPSGLSGNLVFSFDAR